MTTNPPPTNSLAFVIAQPPRSTAPLTEPQFASILAALPALLDGKASTEVTAYVLNGLRLSVSFAAVNGVTQSSSVTVTADQLAAIIAAGPALPGGATVAQVRVYNVVRNPTGPLLNVQFSSQ